MRTATTLDTPAAAISCSQAQISNITRNEGLVQCYEVWRDSESIENMDGNGEGLKRLGPRRGDVEVKRVGVYLEDGPRVGKGRGLLESTFM
jgi:hypothetical protein